MVFATDRNEPVWQKVSKSNPCPLCAKTDWCSVEQSGDAVLCGRVDLPPSGWKRIKIAKDGRFIFALEGSDQQRRTSKQPRRQPRAKKKSAPLPESLQLAKMTPATDSPQPQPLTRNIKGVPGTAQEIIFPYSDTQFVSRYQWAAENAKGREKTYRQWHKNGEGKISWGKGDQPWMAYRLTEALAAAVESGATAILAQEGEPCVETARSLGIPSITWQGSAWSHEDLKATCHALNQHNLTLIFLPDPDEAGFKKVRSLGEACREAQTPYINLDPIRLWEGLEPPHDKVDLVDLVAAGMDGDEIVKRLHQQMAEILDLHHSTSEDEDWDDDDGGDGGKGKKRKLPPADIIGEEIAEEYRDRLAYNNENGIWYRYEADANGVWSAESEEYIESIVCGILRGKGLKGWDTRSYITNTAKAIRDFLIERKWVERPANELLPFENGVLEVATGKLLPHSPGYRFTWSLPRQHNPLATDWPKISDWMDTAVAGNAHLKKVLVAFAAAVLRGRGDLQKVLHLIGIGGSGKGTLLNLLVDLIGNENCHTTTLEEWCSNRFESAQVYRKRLVLFPDEDKGTKGLSRFKSLTGGDWLRAEEKMKKPFKFQFDGMVAMGSNFPIFSGDNSSGIARRMITVPFNATVAQSQRRDLNKEFQPELAAFTNHLLSLSDDWVERVLRGIADVPEISLQFWENKIREDSVAGFLNDRLIYDPTAQTSVGSSTEGADTLYAAYSDYCKAQGHSPKAVKNFSPDLLELCQVTLGWTGIEKAHTKTGRVIRGLRLRKPGQDDHIGTWDFELREKCDRNGEGLGEGLVKDAVKVQDVGGERVSPKVKDKTTIGCENFKTNIKGIDEGQAEKVEILQTDIAINPSPELDALAGKGSDPSPAPFTESVTNPSPKFKVGDRVVIHRPMLSDGKVSRWHGKQGEVVALDRNEYRVQLDGDTSPMNCLFDARQLRRLEVAKQIQLFE